MPQSTSVVYPVNSNQSKSKRKLVGRTPIYYKPYEETNFRALCGITNLYDNGTEEVCLLNNDLITAWDKACANHD